MGRVHLIATGGTIAMAEESAGKGAVLALGGGHFARQVASTLAVAHAELTSEEYGPLPSSHFSLQHLWGLRQRVHKAVLDPSVDGVVVTHGTDSLEETAYLLDLTVPGDKPMIVTGAMRIASQPGYDGIANLVSAVRAATSRACRGLGCLVLLNDEIHAARDVTKMHTQSPATFQSPFSGPLGHICGETVRISRHLARNMIVCSGLEPQVYLFKLAVGMDASLFRHAVGHGMRGAVIESFGGGRIPPWWLEEIQTAIAGGVAVAATSRCPAGPLYDPYAYRGAYHDLVDSGCFLAHNLNGQKARLRLMAALATAGDMDEARLTFQHGL